MGTLSLVAPLVLFEKSRLWAGTGFHLLPSFHHHHHPIQHNYTTPGIGRHVLNEVSRVWVAGAAGVPPPPMPPPTVHTERSGANCPSVFTSKHVFVKAGKEMYISRIVRGEVFCCAQDDNVRCLLCSKVKKKGTHKWNIKPNYDNVCIPVLTLKEENYNIGQNPSLYRTFDWKLTNSLWLKQLELAENELLELQLTDLACA